MSSHIGRPKSQNPKNKEIKIRATDQDREKLLYCCKKTGKTQYEVIMEGIDKVYNEITK